MIPSYNHIVTSPGFDRYQPTNSYFDYFSPGTVFGGIKVSEKGSYVIRSEDVLACQLAEMFFRDLPEIVYKGEYISKGILNIDKMHMYKYLHDYNKNSPIPSSPNDANRYVGNQAVVNYVCWKITHALSVAANGGGQILAYRFRYVFPAECVFHPIKVITNTLYKNLKNYIICYSYFYNPLPSNTDRDGLDVIVSNAPFRPIKGKKHRTLSSFMNYTTDKINSDLEYAVRYNMYH